MGVQLKLPEVARRLGVSEKTARRYVKSGTLPSMFVGNAYRVSEEDVERFLQDSKVTAGGDSGKVQRRSSPEPEIKESRAAAHLQFEGSARPDEVTLPTEELDRLFERAIRGEFSSARDATDEAILVGASR